MYHEINIDYEPLKNSLNKILEVLNYDKSKCKLELYNESLDLDFTKSQVDEKSLYIAKQTPHKDKGDTNAIYFDHFEYKQLDEMVAKMVTLMKLPDFGKSYGVSNKIWYPSNGYMGWHTNSKAKGWRLYCSHAREDNKSFFRYQDPKSGEIITSWDKKGWKFRLFLINEIDLWHCVYSETDRISLGYRFF
jgi:hypothetical protein